MRRATYTKSQPVVRIVLLGGKPRQDGLFPRVRELDRDLRDRFFKFLDDEGIRDGFPTGTDGGTVAGYYTVEEAAKIEAWMLEQGIEKDETA